MSRVTCERYRLAHCNPLLAQKPRAIDVATFVVVDDSLVFLRLDREQSPVEDSIPLGTFPG